MGFYKGLSGTRGKALLTLEREWRRSEDGGGRGRSRDAISRQMVGRAAATTMIIIIDRFSLGWVMLPAKNVG